MTYVGSTNEPIVVICESCGVLFDIIRSGGSCPVCGSASNASISFTITVGGTVHHVSGGNE